VVAFTFGFGCGGRASDSVPGPPAERCALSERTLSSKLAWPDPDEAPALSWNGAGYGVAWMDFGHGISPMDYSKSGTYFAAVDAAGNIVEGERRVAAEALGGSPALAWIGSGYVLVTASNAAHFAELDVAGEPSGQATAISEDRSFRSPASGVAVSGQSLALVWRNTESSLVSSFLACLDPASASLIAEGSLASRVRGSIDANVVWSGDAFGVTWADDRNGSYEIYFAEFDARCQPRTAARQVSDSEGEASHPNLSWSGAYYGLSWLELSSDGDSRVRFERVTRAGDALGGALEWGGRQLGLAWTGSDFALVYQTRLKSPNSLYLARIDAAGVHTKDQLVAEDWTGYVWTAAAWNEGRLALVSTQGDIVFRVAECP
jgi:hypothetical protein